MAIEIFYTLASDKSPRKWRDSDITCGGSWATFMAFMDYMEKKYLPSLPAPAGTKLDFYFSRFAKSAGWDKSQGEHPMQEVWDLQLSPKTTHAERLTMASMMNRCYFLVSEFPKMEEAWMEVTSEMDSKGAEDAFNGLAKAIHKVIDEIPGIHSLAINWTSVVNFYEVNGKTDKKFYDFVADNAKVESQIEESIK